MFSPAALPSSPGVGVWEEEDMRSMLWYDLFVAVCEWNGEREIKVRIHLYRNIIIERY